MNAVRRSLKLQSDVTNEVTITVIPSAGKDIGARMLGCRNIEVAGRLLRLQLVVTRCHDACGFVQTKIQKEIFRPWLWAYFTNGPDTAASSAPTLIRHCSKTLISI